MVVRVEHRHILELAWQFLGLERCTVKANDFPTGVSKCEPYLFHSSVTLT